MVISFSAKVCAPRSFRARCASSLIGHCRVMYCSLQPHHLFSLMALTISTGFVFDDAIVMIENNIQPYIEEGESPLQSR